MHKIFKAFVIEAVALYLTSQITTGLIFSNGIVSLVLTAVGLTLANKFVRPAINLLLLPLNLVTFNLFRFVSVAITLFIVNLILSDFSVGAFKFIGLPFDKTLLPSISLPAGILSYIGFSFIISLISSFAHWLLK